MTGSGGWEDAYSRAQTFVRQLTLAEKVNLTTGTGWETERCVGQVGAIPRLGFRSLCMQDSPVGVRDTDFNSVFPAGGTIAASFDRQLFYQRGFDMGSEHKGKGVDVQLGPVVGPLGRSPEGGRNWEGGWRCFPIGRSTSLSRMTRLLSRSSSCWNCCCRNRSRHPGRGRHRLYQALRRKRTRWRLIFLAESNYLRLMCIRAFPTSLRGSAIRLQHQGYR